MKQDSASSHYKSMFQQDLQKATSKRASGKNFFLKTFDDSTKYSSQRVAKKGQLSVRHLKSVKREPILETSPELKLETKVSNGATMGDQVEESEPLNLNFELLLNAQQSQN